MAYIPPPLTFDFGLENLDSLPLEGCAAPVAQRSSHHRLHPWPILIPAFFFSQRPAGDAGRQGRREAPRALRQVRQLHAPGAKRDAAPSTTCPPTPSPPLTRSLLHPQDCGACYNCTDKPKFGGPGVKKQACINRKCLMMVPKEDADAERIKERKRPKQHRNGPSSPPKLLAAGGGFGLGALNAAAGMGMSPTSIIRRMPRSPVSSPDISRPTSAGWSYGADDDDEYGGLSPAGDNNRVVGVGGADHDDAEEGAGETPNPSRLAASVDGAGGFVRSSSSNVLRGLEALGGITSSEEVETDLIEGALPPALRSAARGEWKQMREVELAAEVAGKGNSSSWTWNNPMLLQEEFISMNERHRRESSTTTNPIVVN
jgi:hypothetical protein